ncbi:MAG: hydrogenase expression/formation protein HypE [Candidatus Omnitrophica bacterium]|nr:hydrogenase expression/formation protein HypE [Candidatus Omnitrophota bacterium]
MEKITLAHGSGGTLMHGLIDSTMIRKLDNPILRQKKDSAILRIGKARIAFTTDSYVVSPIFFPGGDIGSLAVHGTVNDLSVCGARPLFLSLGLIIEEGLDKNILDKVIRSAGEAAGRAGVDIVTGDTKVVERGACDKIFINTSGVGDVYYEKLSVSEIRPGDVIIASGTIGEHARAILSQREGIEFGSGIKTDSAPLNKLIRKVFSASDKVRFMRDPTRGGVATTLNEITASRPFGICLEERAIPVSNGVRQACELLGFDPLYLACEGRFLMVVGRKDAAGVLNVIRGDSCGKKAAIIGEVTKEHKGRVYLNTAAGGKRLVDMLSGEQLPRIC